MSGGLCGARLPQGEADAGCIRPHHRYLSAQIALVVTEMFSEALDLVVHRGGSPFPSWSSFYHFLRGLNVPTLFGPAPDPDAAASMPRPTNFLAQAATPAPTARKRSGRRGSDRTGGGNGPSGLIRREPRPMPRLLLSSGPLARLHELGSAEHVKLTTGLPLANRGRRSRGETSGAVAAPDVCGPTSWVWR